MYYKTTSLNQQVLALLSVNNPNNATGLILMRSQYSPEIVPKVWLTLRLAILERAKLVINLYALWGLLLTNDLSA
jgi:hypothetical protein